MTNTISTIWHQSRWDETEAESGFLLRSLYCETLWYDISSHFDRWTESFEWIIYLWREL